MISRLRGQLLAKTGSMLLIDVSGVGYEVEVSTNGYHQLPDAGAEVVLFTHLAIREDAHSLYGFVTEAERSMFRELLRVNGVGARLALAIVSGITVGDLAGAILEENYAALTALSGVGKKTAERIVLDLRDRMSEWAAPGTGPAQLANSDIMAALQSLGYKPQEAREALKQVDMSGLSNEEAVRAALKVLGGN